MHKAAGSDMGIHRSAKLIDRDTSATGDCRIRLESIHVPECGQSWGRREPARKRPGNRNLKPSCSNEAYGEMVASAA